MYAQDPSTVTDAYDLATKARKTLPDDPQLSELLVRLSYEKKEYPGAIQLFQETARKRPLDADSLFYLGMSQLQASQTAEARGALNQALAGGLQEPLASEAKRALASLPATPRSTPNRYLDNATRGCLTPQRQPALDYYVRRPVVENVWNPTFCNDAL